MTVIIKQCVVDDLLAEPNFAFLLDEYANELAIDGLPHPRAKIEMYKQLEGLEKIHSFAAYVDDGLVGIINVLMVENPHHDGLRIAVTESYFVLIEHRKTGAGILLRRQAEADAEQWGSPGLFISAKAGSNLALALEASKDYEETNKTFFKRFENV